MKLKYIYFLSLAVATVFTACYKDKGNYSYATVNELHVADTSVKGVISTAPGDTVRLKPVITQTMVRSEENLAFEWKTYENNPSTSYAMPETIQSNARNLELVIKSPFKLGANYKIEFKVTDKQTGISQVLIYDLSLVNKYAQGLMLLEDFNGATDLSMILPQFNNEIARKVLTSLNPGLQLGKPVKLEMSNFTVSDGFSIDAKKLYVLSENNGIELNYLTMVKQWDYNYLFHIAPAVIKPERLFWTSTTVTGGMLASIGVAINDKKVFANQVGGFPGTKKWGQMLISPAGDYNYSVAPYIAGGTTYVGIVYDNQFKKFYSIGTTNLQAFPAAASTVFDMNNVGLEMLYMDSANVNREYNAIMKDAGGAPFYLRFNAVSTTQAPNITLIKTAMSAQGITTMTAAVSSSVTPHIYYASGGKIYRYETTSNTTVEQLTLPASEQVTKMKFMKSGTADPNTLVVATWDGTQGRVYYYPVGSLGGITSFSRKFEGFGKIVDIAFKIL